MTQQSDNVALQKAMLLRMQKTELYCWTGYYPSVIKKPSRQLNMHYLKQYCREAGENCLIQELLN